MCFVDFRCLWNILFSRSVNLVESLVNTVGALVQLLTRLTNAEQATNAERAANAERATNAGRGAARNEIKTGTENHRALGVAYMLPWIINEHFFEKKDLN